MSGIENMLHTLMMPASFDSPTTTPLAPSAYGALVFGLIGIAAAYFLMVHRWLAL